MSLSFCEVHTRRVETMTFLTFKVPTKIANSVKEELAKISIPTVKTKDQNKKESETPLVYLRIYNHVGKRVTEINVDISHIPLMISLSQSWEDFHKTLDYLKGLEKEIAEKVIQIMTRFRARQRDYSVKYSHEGSKWIQLGILSLEE